MVSEQIFLYGDGGAYFYFNFCMGFVMAGDSLSSHLGSNIGLLLIEKGFLKNGKKWFNGEILKEQSLIIVTKDYL